MISTTVFPSSSSTATSSIDQKTSIVSDNNLINKKEENNLNINNKTEIKLIKNNFFIKNSRNSDYNLNILDSELVTFRKNFYHHVPKRRINKIMEGGNYPPPKVIGYSQKSFNQPTTSSSCHQQQTSQLITDTTINLNNTQNDNKLTRDKESERIVWEMWMRTPNTTPASTVLNSPDLTEIEPNKNYQNQSHQIKVGRSPVGGQTDNNSPILSIPNNLAVVSDGEVVVFDDIEENWQRNKNTNLMSSTITSTTTNHEISDKQFEEFENFCYGNIMNNRSEKDENEITENSKLTKMIGALPINDYEGSPRRFGNIHYDDNTTTNTILNQQKMLSSCNLLSSSSLFPPRPGFPQRIISPSNEQQYCDSNVSDEQRNDTQLTIEFISNSTSDSKNKESTFDYLYEFSETRKVLEEFFKCPNDDERKLSDLNESDCGSYLDLNQIDNPSDNFYIGQRLAKIPKEEYSTLESPRPCGVLYNSIQSETNYTDNNEIELYLDSGSRSSGELADTELEHNNRRHSRNFTLSPETTDYDSNCGDLDSLSNDVNGGIPDFVRLYTSMPVLEDGLSSGHASDTENNNPISIAIDRKIYDNQNTNNKILNNKLDSPLKPIPGTAQRNDSFLHKPINNSTTSIDQTIIKNNLDNSYNSSLDNNSIETCKIVYNKNDNIDIDSSTYSINNLSSQTTSPPPPPAPVPHRSININTLNQESITTTATTQNDVQAALRDIKTTLQRTQKLSCDKINVTNIHENLENSNSTSPIWIPRNETSISHESLESEIPSKLISCDEEEADTDLETDRLLGQQRLDDQGFYDDKNWCDRKINLNSNSARLIKSPSGNNIKNNQQTNQLNFANTTHIRSNSGNGVGLVNKTNDITVNSNISTVDVIEIGSNDELLQKSPSDSTKSKKEKNGKSRNKEGFHDPAVLIEGVLFRARYLGSTQLVCEGQPTKTTRMMQAEEAVSRIKAPEGESQPSTEVDLFISTEKIMVLNTDLKEIMMDHALRTISYIADIGDLVVLMARRRFVPSEMDDGPKPNRTPKMICHVFESEEAQFIAQSIGQAFQVAYMEFLKANGIEDHSFVKEMDYQEVLNSQEIFGDELEIFAKKELQKEVVVPKAKGEILGVVIVESGWGSMLPTVVIANLLSSGAAARCGQLNIGDQIIAINGLSLVGLPLSTCQNYIRNTKTQTAVKFTVVPCPPVVEVKIKRPNTKYQLGFSVQNGVICSLLRGGIAERGGVRVGHRIIEINNQSVVAVPHEKIVNVLATSVGEILMKTMPTSMFRLLTGQENPVYI